MTRARTPAQKAAHAARMRAWARRNPELSRQRNAASYAKHREARQASQRIRNNRFPEARAAIERARYHAKRAAAALIQLN